MFQWIWLSPSKRQSEYTVTWISIYSSGSWGIGELCTLPFQFINHSIKFPIALWFRAVSSGHNEDGASQVLWNTGKPAHHNTVSSHCCPLEKLYLWIRLQIFHPLTHKKWKMCSKIFRLGHPWPKLNNFMDIIILMCLQAYIKMHDDEWTNHKCIARNELDPQKPILTSWWSKEQVLSIWHYTSGHETSSGTVLHWDLNMAVLLACDVLRSSVLNSKPRASAVSFYDFATPCTCTLSTSCLK
jgi:hypothetical protein